jgi:shikimate kinase
MGAGKTTVGRLLADRLNRAFLDTDEMVVEREGRSIPDIFESVGEPAFRDLETQTLTEISKLSTSVVVSLGGGVVLRDENWQLIHESGVCCYLNWPIQTLLNRILNDRNRPLVAGTRGKDRELRLIALWQERQPFYSRADFRISCSNEMSPSEVAESICSLIQRGN